MSEFARRMKLALGSSLFLMLGTCATTQTSVIDTSCRAFGTLTYSRHDTLPTINEIRQHNAAWRAICEVPNDYGS